MKTTFFVFSNSGILWPSIVSYIQLRKKKKQTFMMKWFRVSVKEIVENLVVLRGVVGFILYVNML